MIKLSEQDTALLEKKLQVVTYDGEVYQKDIYLSYLLKMNELALARYARNYLK